MVNRGAGTDDGRMEDTKDQSHQTTSAERSTPDDDFDPRRLRTLADMRRSKDDRMLAGVCSGAAKYLNVDPIVIRVIIAVLTFVGLAGLILYLAAWFLLPPEGEQSIAADWFNLDKNEQQFRMLGLVGAAVLAAVAIVGDSQWAWWGLPWVLVPLAVLYWLFVVRPRRHDPVAPPDPDVSAELVAESEDTAVLPADGATDAVPSADGATEQKQERVRRPRKRRSSALTGLTLSVAAIAVAITVLVDQSTDVSWTTYLAVALGVVTVGLLVGMFFGGPGPLILVGLVLAALLIVGSLMPSAGMGEKVVNPVTAADVNGTYEHGFGPLRVDLTNVSDPEQLLGSTLTLENGAGDVTVTIPDDLNVAVDAQVDGGEIRAFGRTANGTDVTLVQPADEPDQPALTLRIRQTFGGIEVIER
jgi:phage shock protein PspC (stress-responsive transcriptional regulator)